MADILYGVTHQAELFVTSKVTSLNSKLEGAYAEFSTPTWSMTMLVGILPLPKSPEVSQSPG